VNAATGPPDALVRTLVDGPSPVAGVEWHDEVTSTMILAAEAAARGEPEIHVVLADVQTAGRGRLGRGWEAPAGSSLMGSYLFRPAVPPSALRLLPLLSGLALADVVARFCPGADVGLKWPNDLLMRSTGGGPWRKAAGILAEGPLAGAVVVGVGVNVDWRGLERPPALGAATSLVESHGGPVDRWRLFAAFVGVLGRRYGHWAAAPTAFLDDYRRTCLTVGQRVRVATAGGEDLVGEAAGVGDDGALRVRLDAGPTVAVSAGDVTHVRPG
jgi:BirA family transcriptional regulator, biotin operon repressor / biotin---[acetyl-CoA-carboxylase] ligase